jgi:hypothetical protein
MKARIDAGTDIALIGAWDGGRGTEALKAAEAADQSAALESDAFQGHLFLIHTGADVGGPIDVYIDETAPPAVHARIKPIAERARLSLPSGSLVVGGVEDYRSTPVRSLASVINVPPGDYAVRCFVPTNPEQEPVDGRSSLRLTMVPCGGSVRRFRTEVPDEGS